MGVQVVPPRRHRVGEVADPFEDGHRVGAFVAFGIDPTSKAGARAAVNGHACESDAEANRRAAGAQTIFRARPRSDRPTGAVGP